MSGLRTIGAGLALLATFATLGIVHRHQRPDTWQERMRQAEEFIRHLTPEQQTQLAGEISRELREHPNLHLLYRDVP